MNIFFDKSLLRHWHFFLQGTTANCQKFMIELLSSAGRKLVIAIMGQKHTLFPYGTEPLKCIVTAYTSLTGSDKWVLASIMLLVFKPLLQDVDTMVRLVWVGLSYT